jgi:type I restriction enzyme S subunit
MKQGWVIKKLDDVCLIKGRIGYRGYTKNDLVKKGEGAISLSPSNINDNRLIFDNCTYISWDKYNESPEIMIYEGDIIFCKTASIGKMALVDYLPEKATLNPQFVVLKNISCSNKYLYYFMICEDFKMQVKNIIGGTAVPTLSQKNLGNLKLPLPSLPEQQRIVSILDECFAAIDQAKANAEKNLQNTKDLFESYLQGIVSNGNKWEKKTLAQISTTFGRGKSKHRPRNWEGLYGGMYPFIQTGDIRNCNHYITEYTQTYNEAGLAQSKLWPSGTICITIAANIAETGILTFDACFPDSVIGIVVNEKLADRDFVEYLLQSFKVRIQSLGKGSAQANINIGTFENELFPFPPVQEQKVIVEKLNQLATECKKLEETYIKKSNDLEDLKKSILQKAFAGELKTEKALAV